MASSIGRLPGSASPTWPVSASVQNRLLGLADFLATDAQEATLLVGVGHRVGNREHEPAVVLDLFRRRLTLQQLDRVAESLVGPLGQLLGAARGGRVQGRGRRDDCVEQLAPSPLARFGVGPGQRKALPQRAAAVGVDHSQRGQRRRLNQFVPFLRIEIALAGHL
jgi:hypothetical protein